MAIGAAGGNDAPGAGRMNENANLQCSIFGTSPKGWYIDRLRDRLSRIVGGEWGEDPATSDDGIDIVVVRVADIRGLDVTTTDLTIRNVKETKIQDRLIGKQSILIEKSGGGEKSPVGRSVLGRAIHEKAICSNFMAKTDCLGWDDTLFIAYLLDAMYSSGVNTAHIQQTTGIQNLRVADYLNSIVALPPLPEQIRIAAYLDASCTAIDAAVNAKKKQLEALTALRKETIHRVVTRGLDKSPALRDTHNSWIEKIPVGWDLVCLKRISDIQTGLTLGKVYEGPTVERPYLRVANVQDGHLDLTDVTLIEVPLSVASRVRLCVDDVLMTEGGDLDKLGRGFLWKGEIADCLHQNHIFAVRCFRHKLLPMFLTYLTASRYGRDYFEATGKKTTNLAATNSTKVGAFPIPLPPLDEQERLIAYLDKYLGDLTALFSNIESQIATLIDYRKSLIHECVTGQRRISEADVAKVERTLEQAAGLPQQ